MVIYLSGPITGTDINCTIRKFNATKADIVFVLGWCKDVEHIKIINPCDIAHWGLDWETYMAIAGSVIHSGKIDCIYMLPGWEQSEGCKLEYKWCLELGIPVVYNSKDLGSVYDAIIKTQRHGA